MNNSENVIKVYFYDYVVAIENSNRSRLNFELFLFFIEFVKQLWGTKLVNILRINIVLCSHGQIVLNSERLNKFNQTFIWMDFYDWLSFPLSWKYAVNKHNKEFNFLKNTILYLTEVLVKNSKQISYGKNTVGTDYDIMFQ